MLKFYILLIVFISTCVLSAPSAHQEILCHKISGFSLRIIVVAGEHCKVTGELLRKREALSGNERNLAGEFCVVDGELSDL